MKKLLFSTFLFLFAIIAINPAVFAQTYDADGSSIECKHENISHEDQCIPNSYLSAAIPLPTPDTGGVPPTFRLPTNPADEITSPGTFITDVISKVLPIVIGIGGFLTVVFIVISGIQLITSSGNPEGVNAARTRLTYAIVGFVLLTLSFVIVQLINTVFLGTSVF